ncbi:DUF362 domain-containing protein [Desulforhopalus sp. IMCC35007]|uniref:DUF362 domain-containing protein n=1 Tax=Desulforhopalus sp. IMCC35007 TaxID=2569543 RepID=UPI0010ADA9F2|nr:DUF362 domain-containing protein [Desulforhopalus sp. IMCC35007]TKB10800.1 DUF362 domain-containing protein [Desulforhopalus sp. IMCC35007]
MNRRQFIQQALAFSAGFSFSLPEVFAAPVTRPDLAIVTGKNYRDVVVQSIELLGGIEQFVHTGDTVVVKPNIGWDRNPEQAANTNPLVVKGLIELALDAGASRVDLFDHTCNEKRRCYQNSGMVDMVKSFGSKKVRLEHIDPRKFIPVQIEKGKSLTSWEIYEQAISADVYINVPVAKHHGLGVLSLGLKNSMGVIGGNRGKLHHDLGQRLADLATVVSPTLTVIDATRILLRNGPQGGSLDDVKQLDQVIASVDPVAADAYGTTLFGLVPEDIASTVAANKMGLGQMDLTKVNMRKKTL